MKNKKQPKRRRFYALVETGCRTPAVDADGRLEIYSTAAAASNAPWREPTDRVIVVYVQVEKRP